MNKPSTFRSLDSRDYSPEPLVLRDPWRVLREVRMRKIVRQYRLLPACKVGLTERFCRIILNLATVPPTQNGPRDFEVPKGSQ